MKIYEYSQCITQWKIYILSALIRKQEGKNESK